MLFAFPLVYVPTLVWLDARRWPFLLRAGVLATAGFVTAEFVVGLLGGRALWNQAVLMLWVIFGVAGVVLAALQWAYERRK